MTRGDIFDDRTKVEMTFVDGSKYVPTAGRNVHSAAAACD